MKYTDDGTITLHAETHDGRLEITVSDTGVGIPADELARIFDEFHRVDSPDATLRAGTGLGLAISQRLARALGGDITVESGSAWGRPSGWTCRCATA